MDVQQLDVADADRILVRSLTPLRRFSPYGMGALVCAGMGLPFIILFAATGLPSVVPIGWVLLGAFSIGAMVHVLVGGQRLANAWAWAPFRAERRTEALAALKAFAVHPLVYQEGDVGHTGTSRDCWATGVAWDGEFLYVLDRGMGARIPPALVREWRWTANQAGTTGWFATGNHLDIAMAKQEALAQDDRNAARVAAGNGLFLSVRDLDRPTWQFQTSDEPTLRRWAEVLNQVFEGQAPQSAPAGDPKGDTVPSRIEPHPTGTAPAKGGPGQWKLLVMVLLGVLLFAVAAIAVGAMSAYLFG